MGKDLKIFEKHGLDVEIIMITGAARSVAALWGNSTHFPPVPRPVRWPPPSVGSDVKVIALHTTSSPMLSS